MKKVKILILLGGLLIGCSSREVSEKKIYKGTYTYGHEVRIFQDEETKINYWLDGDKKKLEELNNYMKEKNEREKVQYSKVKIQIKGEDTGKATNGFAEPEDRKMRVVEYKIIK